MSYNSDAASPATPDGARDWIFPSYSFVHSTNSHHQRNSRRRRFSTYPTRFNSAAASFPSRPAADDSTPVLSSYPSKFSGFRRRRFELGRNYEKSTVAVDDTSDRSGVAEINPKDEVASKKCELKEAKTTSSEKKFFGFLRGRLRVRWQLVFTAAVSKYFLSLFYLCNISVPLCKHNVRRQ